jgi:hypothetical protein
MWFIFNLQRREIFGYKQFTARTTVLNTCGEKNCNERKKVKPSDPDATVA